MLRKVSDQEVSLLRDLEVKTYQATFGPYIQQADLDAYYQKELSLAQIEKDLADPESETYFVLHEGEIAGFLKVNWGQAQSEKTGLESAFEIHRIYLLEDYQGLGLGKEMFDFALDLARSRGFEWAWLGVWEKNFKAQKLYFKSGFERFGQHEYVTGDTVDTDWLLRLHLKK